MLFIWRGLGFVVLIIGVVSMLLMQLVLNSVFGAGTYENNSTLYSGIGLIIAAIVTYLFSKWLTPRELPRKLVDPSTNQTVILKNESSLMFIPVRFWVFIFLGLGLISAIAGLFQ